MGSLALKILIGYWMAGVAISIPLAYKIILGPKAEESGTMSGFVCRVVLFLLLMMLFWPLLVPMFLSSECREAKKVLRSIYNHYCYSLKSDATRVRRLLRVYDVFKRYRPQAREEKLLKATAGVYFKVMRWREVQVRDALGIIEPRIGTEIVTVRDLAKAILILKKPCLGCLSAPYYDEKFRAAGKKDKTIELILGDSSAQDAGVR